MTAKALKKNSEYSNAWLSIHKLSITMHELFPYYKGNIANKSAQWVHSEVMHPLYAKACIIMQDITNCIKIIK